MKFTWGHEGRALVIRLVALYEEEGTSVLPSCHMRTKEKATVCKPGRGLSPGGTVWGQRRKGGRNREIKSQKGGRRGEKRREKERIENESLTGRKEPQMNSRAHPPTSEVEKLRPKEEKEEKVKPVALADVRPSFIHSTNMYRHLTMCYRPGIRVK